MCRAAGSPTGITDKNSQPADAGQTWPKGHIDKVGHAARAGKMAAQQGEDDGNRENKENEQRPCPQAVIASDQRRQRRDGEDSRTQQ